MGASRCLIQLKAENWSRTFTLYPNSLRIPFVICKFHSSTHFPRTPVPKNMLLHYYTLNLFISWVNRYLPNMSP